MIIISSDCALKFHVTVLVAYFTIFLTLQWRESGNRKCRPDSQAAEDWATVAAVELAIVVDVSHSDAWICSRSVLPKVWPGLRGG